jgi:hypothetical protein
MNSSTIPSESQVSPEERKDLEAARNMLAMGKKIGLVVFLLLGGGLTTVGYWGAGQEVPRETQRGQHTSHSSHSAPLRMQDTEAMGKAVAKQLIVGSFWGLGKGFLKILGLVAIFVIGYFALK